MHCTADICASPARRICSWVSFCCVSYRFFLPYLLLSHIVNGWQRPALSALRRRVSTCINIPESTCYTNSVPRAATHPFRRLRPSNHGMLRTMCLWRATCLNVYRDKTLSCLRRLSLVLQDTHHSSCPMVRGQFDG